jgi:hypothetical protein
MCEILHSTPVHCYNIPYSPLMKKEKKIACLENKVCYQKQSDNFNEM